MGRNLITENDISADETILLFRDAKHFKKLRKKELAKFSHRLVGRRMLLLFYEPSTRTRISFELSARNLGIQTTIVESSYSSAMKGESLVDEAQTFDALGFDVVVMRHPEIGAVKNFSLYFTGSVINAGDGINAHPTQALVDAFTLWERGLLRSDVNIGIVGDILNSRVARSNARLLNKFGILPSFIAPPEFLPKILQGDNQLIEVPGELGYRVHVMYDLDEAIEKLDVIMMLRVQRERYESLPMSIPEFSRRYQLNSGRLSKLKPSAVIMHPGPVNRAVEISDDVFADSRCLINEQVANGVPLRMALLNFLLE